jgi:hypothetical protein
MVWVVNGYQKNDDVFGARYNCNMCHTAQSTNVDTPNNRFVSARKKMKKQSHRIARHKKRAFRPVAVGRFWSK